MQFKNYIFPETLEEAFQLNQNRQNHIVAGNLWLRFMKKPFVTAIDLEKLNLRGITEAPDGWRIGAMTPLHELETHPQLNEMTGNAIRDVLQPIVGVQFRNAATVGGSVWARFGFSDVITLLLALNATVELYPDAACPLEEFIRMPYDRRILTYLFIPWLKGNIACASQRASSTGFSLVNCAVTRLQDQEFAVVGARPGKAVRIDRLPAETEEAFLQRAGKILTFESNFMASAEYRRQLAEICLRRCFRKLNEKEAEA